MAGQYASIRDERVTLRRSVTATPAESAPAGAPFSGEVGRPGPFRGGALGAGGRWLSLVAVLLAVASAGLGLGFGLSSGSGGLSDEDVGRIEAVVSILEHDSPVFQYGYIEDRLDGRGYSAGRGAFSTSTGDLVSVIEDYTARVPHNVLARFEPTLRELTSGSASKPSDLNELPERWRSAAGDEGMRAAQDAAMDRLFLEPAKAIAGGLGVRSVLGTAILYDTLVQHGSGEGPDDTGGIAAATTAAAGGTPASGIAEPDWLARFLDQRRAVLLNPTNPERQGAWASRVGRVDALRALLESGNDGLEPPFTLNPYGTPHHIAGDAGRHEAVAPEDGAPKPAPGVTWLPVPTLSSGVSPGLSSASGGHVGLSSYRDRPADVGAYTPARRRGCRRHRVQHGRTALRDRRGSAGPGYPALGRGLLGTVRTDPRR